MVKRHSRQPMLLDPAVQPSLLTVPVQAISPYGTHIYEGEQGNVSSAARHHGPPATPPMSVGQQEEPGAALPEAGITSPRSPAYAPPAPRHFDGATFDYDRDAIRLTGQLARVRDYLADHAWHTLAEIQEACAPGTQTALSARARDLRKPKFGGYQIDAVCVSRGFWIYRMAEG